MALENVGLGGVLTFDEKAAVAGMRNAGSAADKFSGQFGGITNVAKAVGEGLGQLGASMAKFGLAAAPATVALGAGFKQSTAFEAQMSAVGAVTRASAEDMKKLEEAALDAGQTTVFSATEAGQGLELLGRAGFKTEEQITALRPVLNAAAADGIDLATSADIISNSLKGMGKDASFATQAADILALASAKTNTNMTELGEAFRYAAPEAKTLGIDFATTTAVLGAVADAGLKGSIGGSSFTQAMIKLAKPTKEGAAILDQFHVKMTKTADGGLDVVDVMKQIHRGTEGITDVVERARITEELFGVRGQKAFTAVETAIDTKKIDELVTSLHNADGAAEEMASRRLDNFEGSVKLLNSAVETFSIRTMGAFKSVARESIDFWTKGINDISQVMKELNSDTGLTTETATRMGPTIVGVAKGIKEGIDTVVDAWRTLRGIIMVTIKQFTGGQSPEMIQSFTKIATIIFIVAGAIAPVLVALGGLVLFVTSVLVPAFTAIGGVIGAVFSAPVLAGVAIVVGAFMIIRNEGESVGETFTRIVDNIVAGFEWIKEAAIDPFISGFQWVPNVFDFVLEKFNDFVFEMHNIFGDLIGAIMQAAEALKPFFQVLWTFIGNIVGVAVAGIGLAFTVVLDVIKDVMTTVKNIIVSVVESVVNFIKQLSFGLGYVGEALGFDWGAKLQDFGTNEFKVQAGTGERGLGAPPPEKKLAEQAISKAELAQLDKEAQNELLAMQVGKAVGDNMPKEINVESKVCVDGKTVATATAKHKQELSERAGFKATPWQRRAAVEHGAAPVGGI